MIDVTWEWLGQGLALDLADTVTVENGREHDLIAAAQEYSRWARHEARFLNSVTVDVLEAARPELMELRTTIRQVLASVAAGRRPPRNSIEELNRASRAAPAWFELDADDWQIRNAFATDATRALIGVCARSAMSLIAEQRDRVKRCPAPSCGMFYVSRRPQQRWCSTQCGTRARVARHYRARRPQTT